jgi:hypothetical protein
MNIRLKLAALGLVVFSLAACEPVETTPVMPDLDSNDTSSSSSSSASSNTSSSSSYGY